jgi:hypothetical protein
MEVRLTIFREMLDSHSVCSDYQYRELVRMLTEAIERGFVEELQSQKNAMGERARLFREIETGVVYALGDPGERWFGSWWEVEPSQFFPEKAIRPVGRWLN